MTAWVAADINSDADNPLGIAAEFSFQVEYEYDPGDPENFVAPEVAILRATCQTVRPVNERARPPTAHEAHMLADWFLSRARDDDDLRQQIENCGLDQMCVEPQWDE
jgi:hypothetical protein